MTRIIRLQSENIKRLKAVDITPVDNTVVITGKNGAGKSSILDSIVWALSGKPDAIKPIRDGQEEAHIVVELDNLIVERHFKGDKSTLVVKNKEGMKASTPQKMLDDMLGAISFDPLEFSRMESRKQFDTLKRLVKLEVDIEELERLNKRDFEARTEVNRQRDEVAAQGKALKTTFNPEEEIPAGVDLSALADDHTAKVTAYNKQRELMDFVGTSTVAINKKKESEKVMLGMFEQEKTEFLQKWETRVETWKKNHAAELTQMQAELKDKGEQLEKIPTITLEEVDALKGKIKEGETHNNRVTMLKNLKSNYDTKTKEWNDLSARSKKLTEDMQERTDKKAAAISSAQMPITGLTLSEGTVVYNGIPFSQASSAEQLRVSTAIAMAMNPKLRVIRIKDGSLLDEDGMRMLKEMAKEKDFQVWLESVYTNDPQAVVIEDGEVKK